MNDNLTANTSNEAESLAFLVGSVMRRFCSKCGNPKVFCKEMCQSCYSKMRRNTEKGKAQMIAYNLTKGKEAQRRYRERNKANKPPKPPKPPKLNCECGKPSVAKNLCMTCYQRKKYGRKERAIRNNLNGDVIFKSVLDNVKKGYTILNACKKAGYKSSSLYRLISPLQKAELIAYKTIGVVTDDDF
jgi:hypothetical protein